MWHIHVMTYHWVHLHSVMSTCSQQEQFLQRPYALQIGLRILWVLGAGEERI